MKRPVQHVMEDQSRTLLEELIPANWILRPIAKDYGIDFEIELVDREVVSGNRIWIQLKAARRVRLVSHRFVISGDTPGTRPGAVDTNYVGYRIETKLLSYALKCAFPLLLFVADLGARDIYWLPLRDDILSALTAREPNWEDLKSVTLRIPHWNTLSSQKTMNYPALRWYALEPARMYAFATLHHYYHESAQGRLSGYEIGEGFVDGGEEAELRDSLALAERYIRAALKLDVLFGDSGVNLLKTFVRAQLETGLKSAYRALSGLSSRKYSFVDLSILLSQVHQAISLFSTSISSYQSFQGKYLFTEETAWLNRPSTVEETEGQ